MHPYEWGILGVKAIALCWLSNERFPRHHRHQPAASLANKIAGARKLLASATDAELHQLACVVPGNAPVKTVVLYTNWLTPGFKSDWQKHSSIQVQTAPSNFLALIAQCVRSRNSCLLTIPIAVLQKPLICKKCSNSTFVRLFDMACYATSVLIRRIQEVSEYKKSIKKQRKLI